MAAQRTNQILDAFEQCIVEDGFEAATLQQVADRASVNLGMIHHYIGRKEDLLQAMVARLQTRVQDGMREFDATVAVADRVPTLLYLFFEDTTDANDRIIDALYASGGENPTVQAALNTINSLYVDIWTAEIGRIHPTQPVNRCREIAVAILGLAYSRSLFTLDGIRATLWRDSAETLLNNP